MCFSRERNQVGRVAVETLRVPLAQLKELLPTREGSCCRFARTRLLVRAENSPSMSLTLAVIKPDAFSRASSIEARLRAANFAVLARATITLLPSRVCLGGGGLRRAQVLLSQPAGRAAPLLEASEGVRGGDPHARTHGRPCRALQSEADESGRVPGALSLGEQQEGGVK